MLKKVSQIFLRVKFSTSSFCLNLRVSTSLTKLSALEKSSETTGNPPPSAEIKIFPNFVNSLSSLFKNAAQADYKDVGVGTLLKLSAPIGNMINAKLLEVQKSRFDKFKVF